MKFWPVPESYSKTLPVPGDPGCFWEDRGDRYHCGVDIYAATGSDVVSVEKARIIDVGVFTSSCLVPYWNTTYYVMVENKSGSLSRYAELENVVVKAGDTVKAGQSIGYVGMVLNSDRINENTPLYIQKINEKGNHSMLHFELFRGMVTGSSNYLGGNWFGEKRPAGLLDPADYLAMTL